ncbi:MAG: HAD hydrolase family protein [Pirellulales bacterium]|nr:HAD hydrolase family protein [Pirellulales bacterium]
MDLQHRCRNVTLILSDVDGVLTDGRLWYDGQGNEAKQFHIRDGMGIRLWREAGHPFGLVTLRSSRAVRDRAAELEVDILRQGVTDKLATIKEIRDELGLSAEQVCYLGDDLPDVPALNHVGLAVAVADACDEARQAADYVTRAPGGGGAVRETIEMILKAHERWDELVGPYVAKT